MTWLWGQRHAPWPPSKSGGQVPWKVEKEDQLHKVIPWHMLKHINNHNKNFKRRPEPGTKQNTMSHQCLWIKILPQLTFPRLGVLLYETRLLITQKCPLLGFLVILLCMSTHNYTFSSLPPLHLEQSKGGLAHSRTQHYQHNAGNIYWLGIVRTQQRSRTVGWRWRRGAVSRLGIYS